jgi:hypothetical protein
MSTRQKRLYLTGCILASLVLMGGASPDALPVAIERTWQEPIRLEAQMGVRGELKQNITAPDKSPLLHAQLHLGESVWGGNYLRIVVNDKSGKLKGKSFIARVRVADADDRETYSHEHSIAAFMPCIQHDAEGRRIPAPVSPFKELESLGIRRHYDDGWLGENDYNVFLPYRLEVKKFPARISVQIQDAADGADLGVISRSVPSFGYVRLHVARCNPFADEEKVPALLRLWLDDATLPGAQVHLRILHDANSKLIREETLRDFARRDLKFSLNLAGLGAGKYRVEAELTGIDGLKELSCVWIEKRPLPDSKTLRVPLVIEELPSVSRSQWPATGGIPVPDGVLPASEINLCAVLDKDGQSVPAQFKPLAFWGENRRFVRWLLVDFQAESRDGKCGPYTLTRSDKPSIAHASPVRIEETADALRVSTGPLGVDFNRRSGNFLRQITLNGREILDKSHPVEAYMRLVPPDGKEGGLVLSTAVSTGMDCRVEEAGPLRSVVRVSGAYGDSSGRSMNECVLRFIFRAGRAEMEMEHTFVWKENPGAFVIKEFGFRLPVKGLRQALGPDAKEAALRQEIPCSILQTGPAYKQTGPLEYAVNGAKREGRFPGWLAASGRGGGVAVLMRDFWQQYPAGIAFGPGLIDLQFWPKESFPLDLRNLSETDFRGNGVGVAKTHQAVLSFQGKDWEFNALRDWAQRTDEPLRVAAHPEAVLASGALWWLHPYDQKNFPDDEQALENIFLGLERQLTDTGVFGCMDWGDMHSKWDAKNKKWDAYRYWLNNETTYDSTTFSTWMQYVRTAQRRYFKFNERRTCHLMDVDTCHFSTNQPPHIDGLIPADYVNVSGLQHRHTSHHWSGATVMHHTLYDDIILYHYLTGRGRPLDVLNEAAATMKTYVPRGHLHGSNRDISMPFRLMGDLYWHFRDFDFWRMAMELHDRLITYSFPDHRGEYGYVWYALFSGDRRYAFEWATHRMIQRNRLVAEQDALYGKTVDENMRYYIEDGDSVLLTALRYYATGDKRALAPLMILCKNGGRMAITVKVPLLKNFPDDAAKKNPPGYDWRAMAAFKYAFAMEALVRADLLRERQYKPALRTNGKGGGRWSDAAAFAETRRPDADTPVVVEKGDTLVYDGDSQEAVAGGITVNPGGSLTFALGRHSLVVRGNILVQDGNIRLLPGSALKVDCDLYSGQYGITVEKGRLEMQGSSSQERDCYLGPLLADGLHDTYLKMSGSGSNCVAVQYGRLSHCDISSIGGQINISASNLDKNKFGIIRVWPFVISGNNINECFFGLFQVPDCVFEGNRVSGTSGDGNHVRRTVINFHSNSDQAVSRINSNVFEKCYNALYIVSTGKRSEFTGNVYTNGSTFSVENSKQPIVLNSETFDGNNIGIAVIAKATEMILNHCSFGRAKPNEKADISAGSARVLLKNCLFGAEPKITVSGEGGVRSEEHNGKSGETKTWGKPF